MMAASYIEVKRILIYSFYIFVVKGSVNLIVTSDTGRCPGSSINISCDVDPQTSAVTIAQPNGSIVVSCTAPLGGSETVCTPVAPYVIVANKVGNTTTFILTILSLKKSIHNGFWNCSNGNISNETIVSVITPLPAAGRSPNISVFPQSGGSVSNATISGHVYCQNSIITSELLYANQDGVYTVLEPQPSWLKYDDGNNGCDRGENNMIYTTTVTRTMSALKGKTVTFKIRFNQTECGSSFTTDSSPVFFFPVPPTNNYTIIKGIGNSLLVEEGESVNLQCEIIGGVPLAYITWNCFGGTVTNTSITGIARSNITFTTTSDNNGQFCTCSATHPVADIMNTSVQIYVTYKPKNVTLQPSNLTYVKHENQRLGPINCSADCNPVCSYTWLGSGSFNVNGSTLYITNIKKDQIGNYNCTASNTVDSKTSENIAVDVYYLPKDVHFEPKTQSYVINETNNLGPVKCLAECHPKCNFTWTGPGNFTLQSSVLIINNTQKEKAGTYNCSAVNTVGSVSSSINVDVNYSPKSVNLLPAVLSYTLNQSQPLGPIVCSADCHPNCTYKWIGPQLTFTSRLFIKNIKKQHEGSYNCTATNILGSKSSENVKIGVNYGPENITLQPPNSSYTIIENQFLETIFCSADCKPNCSFTWNGPGTFNILNQTLKLDNIKRNQSGIYNCTATNILGIKYSQNIMVHVRYAAKLISMAISKNNFTISEHSTPIITCLAEGYPLPSITLRDTKNNTIKSVSAGERLEYKFPNARCEDTGQYQCETKNDLNEITVVIIKTLNVLCAPRRIDKTKQIMANASGVTLNINTMYLANPEPEFIWYFRRTQSSNDSVLRNSTDRIEIYNTFQYKNDVFRHLSQLIRIRIGEEDFGNYIIEAKNVINYSIDSFTIVPEGKPNKPSDVHVNCTKHQSAILTWMSEYDNGHNQSFHVYYETGEDSKKLEAIADPGHHETLTKEINNLKESSVYTFKIVAKNRFGESSSLEVNCTSSHHQKPKSALVAAIAGGFGSAAVIIILIIVFVFVLRRWQHFPSKKGREREMNGRSSLTTKHDDENDEDEMRINDLYVSAGPSFVKAASANRAGNETGPGSTDVVYAVVQKNKDKNAKPIDVSARYDVVDQSEKTGKRKRKQKAETPTPQVYENFEMTNASIGNHRKGPKISGEKNKDGLIYVDLDLEEPQIVGSRFVIHGEENRTNYVEVDFTKRADPLPPEDEAKDTKDKV